MERWSFIAVILLGYLVCLAGCSGTSREPIELAHFSLDTVDGIITRSNLEIDTTVCTEGTGSLKITAEEPGVVRLFETGDIDIEGARLIYSARLRTEALQGQAYLEMWCHFPGEGEYFSRGLANPLSNTVDWTSVETPFFLKKGQNPDNVKLNLVVEGTGKVWIDDIKLLKGPLQ